MPVKTHAQPLAPGEPRRRTERERLLQRGAHVGVGLAVGREALLQQARDRRSWLLPASSPGGGQALGAVGRRDQDRRRACGSSAPLSSGVGLGARAPSRSAAAATRRATPCASSSTAARRARERPARAAQAGQRGLERAAHAVVVGDVLGVVGQRSRRRRVAASIALPSWTMKTLSPATLTASSSSAWTNAARRVVAVARRPR